MKQGKLALLLVCAVACVASVPVQAGGPVSVQVSGGAVTVPNGSVTFSASAPSVTWQLSTPGYRFTSQSINFGSGSAGFTCTPARDGQSIACSMRSGVRSSGGDYTVSVQATSGPAPTSSDPNVWTVSD